MSSYVKVRKAKGKGRKQRSSMGNLAPPQIETNIRYSHRYRFTVTAAAVSTQVTGLDLLGVGGTIGTATNSQVMPITQNLRLKSVSVWAPPPAQGSNATATVEFIGSAATGLYGNKEFSDTSVSTARPAVVHCRPPRGSAASLWQNPNNVNNTLFLISCAAGSIVDIQMEQIIVDGHNQNPIAVATAVIGVQYYLGLSNVSGGNNFPPVALKSTF